MLDAPTITPLLFLMGEIVTDTSICLPSLRTRSVSKCSTLSPHAIRARMSDSSFARSLGKSIPMNLPMASADEYPNNFSAPGFQPVMVPPSVLLIMASSDDSITAARRPRASAACSRSVISASSFQFNSSKCICAGRDATLGSKGRSIIAVATDIKAVMPLMTPATI